MSMEVASEKFGSYALLWPVGYQANDPKKREQDLEELARTTKGRIVGSVVRIPLFRPAAVCKSSGRILKLYGSDSYKACHNFKRSHEETYQPKVRIEVVPADMKEGDEFHVKT